LIAKVQLYILVTQPHKIIGIPILYNNSCFDLIFPPLPGNQSIHVCELIRKLGHALPKVYA